MKLKLDEMILSSRSVFLSFSYISTVIFLYIFPCI